MVINLVTEAESKTSDVLLSDGWIWGLPRKRDENLAMTELIARSYENDDS